MRELKTRRPIALRHAVEGLTKHLDVLPPTMTLEWINPRPIPPIDMADGNA